MKMIQVSIDRFLKRIIIHFLFISFLFFGSCKPDSNNLNSTIEININEATPLKLNDWFSEINYVPLHSGQGNYISEINRVRVTDNHIIVLENLNPTRKIYIYKRNGDLMATIANTGQGPSSFFGVYDFWVNEDQNTIELLDQTQGKIITYNLNGVYVESHSLPSPFQEFVKLSEQEYVLYSGNSIVENNKNNIHYFSFDSGIKKSWMPIPRFLEMANSERFSFSFNHSDNTYLFTTAFNNTIYTFGPEKESFHPTYTVDFGTSWISQDQLNTYKKLVGTWEGVKLLNQSQKVYDFRMLANFKYDIFFSFFLNQKHYYALYDKSTRETKVSYAKYGDPTPNDYDLGQNLFYLCSVYQDYLIFFLHPYELKNHLKNLSPSLFENLPIETQKNFDRLKQLNDRLKEEDNPILVFAKLKEIQKSKK
jgi:hypothetical protein